VKLKYIGILLAAILLGAVAAWAVNEYIISDHVVVDVEELILTLNVNSTLCLVGDTILLNGTLESPNIMIEGATVLLYCNGNYTEQSTQTDVNGTYSFLYTFTEAGTYDFYANATVS
jgi:plastocyanin